MTIDELLSFGASLHYPQLVLDAAERDVVRHGELSWKQLARDTQERIDKATRRVERWQALVEEEVRV